MIPDRNGNVYPTTPMLQGIPVSLNTLLTVTKVRKQERKWAHRKMWNKAKRFNYVPYQVASREILKVGNSIVMHPDLWKEVSDAIESQPTFSMGMHHAPKSASPENHERSTFKPQYQVEINRPGLGGLFPRP